MQGMVVFRSVRGRLGLAWDWGKVERDPGAAQQCNIADSLTCARESRLVGAAPQSLVSVVLSPLLVVLWYQRGNIPFAWNESDQFEHPQSVDGAKP